MPETDEQGLDEQAKNFLAIVFGSLPEVIFALDDHFRVLFVSDAIKNLLGLPPDELLGEHFGRLFNDAVVANDWLVSTMTQLQHRPLCTGRMELRHRDGRRVVVGFSAGRPHEPQAHQISVIGTLRDIRGELDAELVLTARNRSLATLGRITALIAEGRELHGLLEKMLLIVMQTLTWRAACVYVASADKRNWELTAHRGMPRAVTDRYPAVPFEREWVRKLLVKNSPVRVMDFPEIDPQIVELLRETRLEEIQALAIRNKGRTFGAVFFVPAQPMNADELALLEAIGAQFGVAIDNARLLEAIRESQAKYSAVVERANDGIMISQDRVFRFVNKRLADMLGYAVSDMIGMDITVAMPPEDQAELLQRYEARISGTVPKEVYRGRLRTEGGRNIEVEFNATAIEYEGRPASLLFVRDISESLSMERKILEEKETAQFYNDVLTHDVNNFIQTILGSADLLTEPAIAAAEQDREHYLGTLKKTARRCADLIDQVRDLMTIRRLEPASFVPVPLRPLIQEAVEVVRDQCRDMPFDVRLEAADNQFVLGNPLARQIFVNLISNAVRHNSKNERWVRVAVTECSDCGGWRVVVEDNGDGIPAEARAKLYQRYARFSPKEGTGLGMSIVKALIDVMSGTIEVEDRVPGKQDEGARVLLCFPRA